MVFFGKVILLIFIWYFFPFADGSGSINNTESVADITFDDQVKRNFITPNFLGQFLVIDEKSLENY